MKDEIGTADIDADFTNKLQGYDTKFVAADTRLTNLESKDIAIEGNIATINNTLTSQ